MGNDINKLETIVSFMIETVSKTPEDPAGATDYMQVSADFDSNYEREDLQSELISAQIGPAKGQLGILTAGITLPWEWRGSGVEGQAPEFSDVIEVAMGGTKVTTAAEKAVAGAGSTTTVIDGEAGAGVVYPAGSAVLIKEDLGGDNGFEIRPIKSVSTDQLTIDGPVLPGAPSDLTNLGKPIIYNPGSGGETGTGSIWWGNTLKEQFSGSLIETMTLTIEAGQIIKASATTQAIARTIADGVAPHTPSYDDISSLVGLDVQMYLGTVILDAPTITMTLTNEIARQESSKPVSGILGVRIVKRNVEFAINPYKDDTDLTNQTNYDNLTDFSTTLVFGEKDSSGWLPGKSWCIYAPRCYQVTAPSFGDQNNLLTEEMTVRAHRGTGLPEIFINQL